MTNRVRISFLDASFKDIVCELGEGNPGAIQVMMRLLSDVDAHHKDPLLYLFRLESMNIRGTQIWSSFKDFAGSDLDKLRTALLARDQSLVDVVNRKRPDNPPAARICCQYMTDPGDGLYDCSLAATHRVSSDDDPDVYYVCGKHLRRVQTDHPFGDEVEVKAIGKYEDISE